MAFTGLLGAGHSLLGDIVLAFDNTLDTTFSSSITLTPTAFVSRTESIFSSSFTVGASFPIAGYGDFFSNSFVVSPSFVGQALSDTMVIYEGSGSLTGGFQVLGGM